MKILVSGGSGFIGTNLIKSLIQERHEIHVLDNNCSSDLSNIKSFIDLNQIKFYKCDISKGLPEEIYRVKFDQIYNLASPASPDFFKRIPIEIIETNVIGVNNLLKLAKKDNARFLQASTSEVYGTAQISPQREDYWGNVNPNGERSPYDEGKRCAEALIYSYKRKFGMDVRVVRIFNTYGPFMLKNDGRVISNFIVQALTNKDITIYGDGNITRSFCFVDDLVNGIKLLMNYQGEINGPINIGNDTEFKIIEVAKLILKITGSKSKVKFLPGVVDDPVQRRPDLNKANNILNYYPKIKLEDGLVKTIQYFKEVLK